MRISDWSSDVCSSDLIVVTAQKRSESLQKVPLAITAITSSELERSGIRDLQGVAATVPGLNLGEQLGVAKISLRGIGRSEEHTSELQSLMRISYAVFCLKKKKTQ